MFVVKIRRKNNLKEYYVKGSFEKSIVELKEKDSCWAIKDFEMSYDTAKEVMQDLIKEEKTPKDSYNYASYYGSNSSTSKEPLEVISIVQISNYEPKAEYKVIDCQTL